MLTTYHPHRTAGLTLRSARRPAHGSRLRVLPAGDGWSLVTVEGRVLYRGLGIGSRRQCLELARDLGALTLSD